MNEIYNLKIELEFGEFNNSTMQAKIIVNQEQFLIKDVVGKYVFLTDISLPNKIYFEFFGKTPGKDTAVDEHGNIIKDKFIKINFISLDGLKISQKFLEEGFKLTTEDQQEVYTNYIGFNGKSSLDFDKTNVFYNIAKFSRANSI